MLTPRQRVEIVLRGGAADRAPFTVYSQMAPACAAEREMRNRGMCLVKNATVVKVARPNVTVRESAAVENGRHLKTIFYETPAGTLSILKEDQGFTGWVHAYPFKTREDYRALEFFIRDERYTQDYAAFTALEKELGDDFILPVWFGSDPMQCLISHLMGAESFCIEWMENRDEVLKLYQALYDQRRKLWPLVAASPARYVSCGSNVTPEIVGRERFNQYYLPYFQETADYLHRAGQRVGYHFDGNCRLLAPAINTSGMDYIEAFTPAPDTDMTLAEARAAWPDKVLWINFPSSAHLQPDAAIAALALALLEQLPSPAGVLFGITEDMPPDRWRDSCRAIMAGLEKHAADFPGRYRAEQKSAI